MIAPFVYDAAPGRVVFGAGAARTALAGELERLGAERVLLIASPRERELVVELCAPFAARVAARFEEVRPHVPVSIAARARAVAADVRADCLLSVGGGSATGMAKAVALAWRAPILAVPTTYAGSEMTPVWGLTEDRRKTTGRSPAVLPAVIVYDPLLTLSLPAAVTGPSALNAMAHCVEALYAPGANPVTSLLALEAARALARGLPRAVRSPGELDARSELLYGAYLAGACLGAAGSGPHHRICHVLGGAYELPHAQTHAIVLPHVVAALTPALAAPMRALAQALGAEEGAAAALYDLAADSGVPTALRDIGLAPAALEEAVELVAEELAWPAIDRAGVRAILSAALAGTPPG